MNLKEHLKALRELGCVVSGYRGAVTLHHCHGGSMNELPGILRGVGQKPNDWLQIPLKADFHVGKLAVDGFRSVEEWESIFGRQMDHLETVSRALGVNVFKQAGYDREVE